MQLFDERGVFIEYSQLNAYASQLFQNCIS